MEINHVPSLKRNDNFIPGATQNVSGLFIYDGVEECWNCIEGKVDGFDSSQVDSTLASHISECTDSCCLNAKVLTACQTTEYAKACEVGSLCKVVKKDMLSGSPTRNPIEDKFYLVDNSSFTADNGIEPHLDGNFNEVTEGFQNDSLVDTESSDVTTEEIHEDWEAKLKFLLESDDDEDEIIPSTDCDGCSYFLIDMPRLFGVSDNTMPLETTIGFSRHPSKSKEVAVRSNLTAYRPSHLQRGMTLTVGTQQSMNLGMKTKGKQKQPVIKNNYSKTGEENHSNSCSSCPVSALRSQGIGNGTSAMKSPSRHLGVSSGKQDAAECKNFSGEIKSQRVLQVGKKTMRGDSLEDPLKALPPKLLDNSKLHKVQRETNHLGSDMSLHGQRETTLELANVADKDAPFHGQGTKQRDRSVGKWITTGPLEGSQAAEENATAKTEQREINAEASASINNDQERFASDPTVDERIVLAPSYGAAENSALPKVHGKTRFQTDKVTLENSAALDERGGNHEAEEQKLDSNQTTHVPVEGNRTSCDCPDDLCDIPVPVLDVQTEETHAEKAHELNRIKILHDIPRTQHSSKENFQSVLESTELQESDAGLSKMCELSQRLLDENDVWDDDFSCASKEVKSVAAEAAGAKEVKGLNITADGSGRQHVPKNLIEDNQHVSELTIEMKGLAGFSLLKADQAYSRTSKVNSATLPREPDSVDLCSVFQHKREKPPASLIRSDLQNRKYPYKQCEAQQDHPGSIQKSVHHKDTVLPEKTSQGCEEEPAYRFVDVPDDPLEPSQDFLLKQLPNNLGQFSCTEQNAKWNSGHIAKQANEIPSKEHQSPLSRSRINDCLSKEDLSRNFCGKIMAPLISRKQTSLTAINRGTKQENQGKGNKSEQNSERDRSCGIYHNKSNNRDCKAVSDAQNHTYHIPKPNSLMATEPKNDWQALETMSPENNIEINASRPIFIASYKVRFFTEVLLESNKNVKPSASQKCTDLVASRKPTFLESQHVSKLPPHNSQPLVSGKNSSPAKHLVDSMKSLVLDPMCSPFEMSTPAGSNTVQPSTITPLEDYGIGQKTQNGGIGNLTVHGQAIGNLKRASESCNADILALCEHVGQTESIRSRMDSSLDAKVTTSQQDKSKGREENQSGEIMQSKKDNDLFPAPDFEEAEIEPSIRALLGSEQEHPVMVSHSECQKMERQSHSKIMSDEMDTKETQKLVEDDLEESEVEPYMRPLLNSELMYSWHDYLDRRPPFLECCNEKASIPVGRLKSGCTVTTTDPNQGRTFTDGERQNSPVGVMGILERPLPCASEDNCHSVKALVPVQTQTCPLGTNEGDISALGNERTIPLGASEISKRLPPHRSAEAMKNGHGITSHSMPEVPKKPCLERKGSICNDASLRTEVDLTSREEKREEQKMICQKDNRAPKLLRKIHAELFPDFSGNVKLCCQFGEIHSDSTITWTKDSKLLARVHRSARDDLPVSLAIVQAEKKDQGLYHCCLKNIHGKATSDFNLTSEVLEHLSSLQDVEGLEEIEFLQLMFNEDFICDSYLSKSLRGRITTEELHFGEGVHRKAFRSKVLQGLVPPLSPGHPCVLKVHNAIVYGTKNNDELVKKNYKLALQECYVQNTAREYAKIYAAETKPLEGFGEVPEIIPIFLIHRPKNNIPYATVEEELIGEFVKYSVKDGKEINFMRRDSEAGQKCCTFQHWVYEKTSGSLLITDMQGVGMKLTDVGIATPAKGYKGFKGNCSISFIDQFKVLHLCNKYCEMLGLKPLQSSGLKQKKSAVSRIKTQPNPTMAKKRLVQTSKKT